MDNLEELNAWLDKQLSALRFERDELNERCLELNGLRERANVLRQVIVKLDCAQEWLKRLQNPTPCQVWDARAEVAAIDVGEEMMPMSIIDPSYR